MRLVSSRLFQSEAFPAGSSLGAPSNAVALSSPSATLTWLQSFALTSACRFSPRSSRAWRAYGRWCEGQRQRLMDAATSPLLLEDDDWLSIHQVVSAYDSLSASGSGERLSTAIFQVLHTAVDCRPTGASGTRVIRSHPTGPLSRRRSPSRYRLCLEWGTQVTLSRCHSRLCGLSWPSQRRGVVSSSPFLGRRWPRWSPPSYTAHLTRRPPSKRSSMSHYFSSMPPCPLPSTTATSSSVILPFHPRLRADFHPPSALRGPVVPPASTQSVFSLLSSPPPLSPRQSR